METERQPDARDIRELVAFLPRLHGEGKRPLARWKGGYQDQEWRFSDAMA